MRTQLTGLFLACFVYCTVPAQTGQWDSVGIGMEGGLATGVNKLITYDGELYAIGDFTKAGNIQVNNIARWNGVEWDSVGGGLGTSWFREGAAVYNGELYVTGTFMKAGSIDAAHIARWDGVKWDSVGKGLRHRFFGDTKAPAMIVFNNQLYVGGRFDTAGNVNVKNIARWNGTKWDSVGKGVVGEVIDMQIYKNKLYIGGAFDTVDNQPIANIAKWDGTNWSSVGGGIQGTVMTLEVYNDNLYAAGNFNSAGGKMVESIALWNDTVWSSVGKLSNESGNPLIYELQTYQNKLFATGSIDTADKKIVNNITSWNGIKWDSLKSGINNDGLSMRVYDSLLYIGGVFDTVNNMPMNYIARWKDLTTNYSTNKADDIYSINIYPNPFSTRTVLLIKNIKETTDKYLKVAIFNLAGHKVKEQLIKTKKSFPVKKTLYFPNLSTGIYFVKIYSRNHNIYTKKLVKISD